VGVRVKAEATASRKYDANDKKRTKRKSLMVKNEGRVSDSLRFLSFDQCEWLFGFVLAAFLPDSEKNNLAPWEMSQASSIY
jgi:hypothetical protein